VTVECVSLEWHGCRDSVWYVIDLDVLISNQLSSTRFRLYYLFVDILAVSLSR